MVLIGPRPFLLGESRVALVAPGQPWIAQVPKGAPWRFRFLTVNYPRTVVNRVQSTPDLRFTLYSAGGEAYQVRPIPFVMMTTPSGGVSLVATHPIYQPYPGGSTVKLIIDGQIIGTGPAYISITLAGTRGWETMGGR